MITPFEGLTGDYRQLLSAITAQTTTSMVDLWPILNPYDLDGTFDVWATAVKAVIARDRGLSTQAGRDYLDKVRAEFGLDQFPSPESAVGLPDATINARLRSVVVDVKKATGRGVDPAAATADALTTAAGITQQMVLDASRSLVSRTAVRDPSMAGWRRIGRGSCAFCFMLIGRGAVYNALSVRFASHKHCRCSAEPSIRGVTSSVNSIFVPSNKNITDTDRARVREFLAKNNAG